MRGGKGGGRRVDLCHFPNCARMFRGATDGRFFSDSCIFVPTTDIRVSFRAVSDGSDDSDNPSEIGNGGKISVNEKMG